MEDEGRMLKDEGFRLKGVLRTDERTNERTFVIVELLSRLKIRSVLNSVGSEDFKTVLIFRCGSISSIVG